MSFHQRPLASSLRNPFSVAAAADAVVASLGLGAADSNNVFHDHSLLESATAMLERTGILARESLTPARVWSAAQKPDYPDLGEVFARIVNAALLAGYEESANTWQLWTRQRLVPNFTDVPRTRVVGFELGAVPEGGQLPVAVLREDEANNPLATRGVIVRLTRQEFINGDLQFVDLARAAGRAAAVAISRDTYACLAANEVLPDGGALFNSDPFDNEHVGGHANLAWVAAAPSKASLQAAKVAIRAQPGTIEGEPLLLRPRFLIVPSAIEEDSWEALGTPFGLGEPGSGHERAMLAAGRMNLISAPELDASSQTAWYVATDPADLALVEVLFVGNSMVPRIAGIRHNFSNDSIEAAITFDYGVRPGNWRAGYKNPGE